MDNNYTKKVMDFFTKPKNMGELKNADGVGIVGNKVCGDVMKVYIKVGKKKGKNKEIEYVKDIKFKTLGCVAAIATSSMVTQIAKGKTLDDARKITKDDVAKRLGGLPPLKMHCSNLSSEALNAAIDDYYKRKKN